MIKKYLCPKIEIFNLNVADIITESAGTANRDPWSNDMSWDPFN